MFIHGGLLSWVATRNSVTFDEFAHLPAGCAYLKFREFSVYNLSPPLLRMIGAALPMLHGCDPPPGSSYRDLAPKDRHWFYAQDFLRWNARDYHRLFVLGRMGMIPVSMLGAWLVFVVARSVWGNVAGVAACAIWCFEPSILAHGSIVGTDVGTAVAIFGATMLWIRFCKSPGRMTALAAGIAITLALLCKFTALVLVPVMIVIAAMQLPNARRIAVGTLVVAIIALVGINLCYGYWRSFEPISSYRFQSSALMWMKDHLPAGTPVPFPRQCVLGFDAQKAEADLLPPAYAFGQTWRGSKWWYYPAVAAVKVPVGFLLLIALSTLLAFRTSARPLRDWRSLFAAVVIMVVMFMFAIPVNVGIRYILPLFPFVIVFVSGLFAAARPLRIAATVCLLAGVVECALSLPNPLSFTNLFAGRDGWKRVNDSNFDWGQSLLALKRWMDVNHVDRIGLAYFGRVDPSVYGITHTPLIEPGDEQYIAVSSYYLLGLSHRMPTTRGSSDFTSLPFVDRLREGEPVAVVGDTIFIYPRSAIR